MNIEVTRISQGQDKSKTRIVLRTYLAETGKTKIAFVHGGSFNVKSYRKILRMGPDIKHLDLQYTMILAVTHYNLSPQDKYEQLVPYSKIGSRFYKNLVTFSCFEMGKRTR